MTRTTSRLASCLTLTAMLSVGGIAAARAPAETTVTIRAEGSDYFGTVRSTRPARCADGRKIVLYKQKGDEQSPSDDTKIGMDTAEKNGDRYVWNTGNTGIYGKIYARAGRTQGCKADTSPTIRTTRPD